MPLSWKNSANGESIRNYLVQQEKYLEDVCTREGPGKEEACHLHGVFLDTIKGNQTAAKKIWSVNCSEGNYGRSCLKLGENYSQREDGGDGLEGVVELFWRACRLGEPEGCYKLGMKVGFEEETENLKRWRVAERSFMEGCALGGRESCDALGAIYRRGLVPADKKMVLARSYQNPGDLFGGVDADGAWRGIEEAMNLIVALKDLERMEGICKQTLGKDSKTRTATLDIVSELETLTNPGYWTIPQIPRDEAEQLTFGCLHGRISNPNLCHRMGNWMYPRNPDMSSLLFQHNCTVVGSAESCLQLGRSFLTGRPTSLFPRDDEKAAEAFEKACSLGDSRGCYLAGMMRWLGDKHEEPYTCEKSLSRVESLLVQGCAMNLGKSCVALSSLYRTCGELRFNSTPGLSSHQGWFPRWDLPVPLVRSKSFSSKEKDKKLCDLEEFEACAKLAALCNKWKNQKK